MKPNWKDAPGWAQWLAQDADGVWYWYESQPRVLDGPQAWDTQTGRFLQALRLVDEGWDKSLEQRPEVQP